MKDSDFLQIETELDIQLPDSYRSFLSNYPEEADEDIKSSILISDAKQLVTENLLHRQHGWFGFDWPEHYLVVGNSGCGDTYFMVLGKDERVYFADHETGPDPMKELDECWSSESLQEHMEEALEIKREIEEEDRLKEERRKNRKWWEIWK